MCVPNPEPIKVATSADVQAIASLVAQLSSSAASFSRSDLEAMLTDPATTLFATRVGGEIVGITTVVIFRAATGVRAFIDDVVVMPTYRGQRLGDALVRAAIQHAASLGVQKIDLTSRPSREAANRLYQRLGFERRQTNVYRLTLPNDALSSTLIEAEP